nr:MAG: hypothetical protein DIU75_06185 [Mycolicibacterium hassiacum]
MFRLVPDRQRVFPVALVLQIRRSAFGPNNFRLSASAMARAKRSGSSLFGSRLATQTVMKPDCACHRSG